MVKQARVAARLAAEEMARGDGQWQEDVGLAAGVEESERPAAARPTAA